MASIINASNSTGLTLSSDLSGVLQLQQNGVALPALSVAPAFSVYQTSATSVGTSDTKITFDTEEFDTNNNFASSRFTPTVAGYYQINAQLQPSASYSGGFIKLYKNGSAYKSGNYSYSGVTFGGWMISSLVYCNGSTDYLEIYGAFTSAQSTATGATFTWFNGFLARGA